MLDTPASQRTLVGRPATLRWTPTDGDGASLDAGTVTVDVARWDGTALVTGAATSGTGVAERTYTLAASNLTRLDRLTVTWHGDDDLTATTFVDVVGGFYFTLAEAWADRALENVVKFPQEKMIEARTDVEQTFERICHRSFVPTFRARRISGGGSNFLPLDRPDLLEVIDTGDSGVTPADVPASAAGVAKAGDYGVWPCTPFDLQWVHGYRQPTADIKRAAIRYLRHLLLNDAVGQGIPERAISWASPEGGTTTLATPGNRGWHTAIPMVDEILDSHMWRGGLA